MPEGDPIDELTYQLNVDGSEALEEMEETISATQARMEEMDESARGMVDSMAEVGKQVAEWAENLEVSLEQAAQDLMGIGRISNVSVEDAVAAAQDYQTLFEARITNATNRIVTVMSEMGRTIDEEGRAELEKMVRLIAASSPDIDTFESEIDQLTSSLGEMATEAGEVQEQAGGLQGFFQSLAGDVGKFASGLIAGFTVLRGLQEVQQFIRESVAQADEFARAQDQLVKSTQTLQRVQGEAAGTVREWLEVNTRAADLLNENPAQIARVVANFQTMATQLNLTGNEMRKLVLQSAMFADQTGEDLNTVLVRLTRFLQRGTIESLGDLGLALDQASLRQEALALGLSDNLELLTQAELEQVRYNAAVRELGLFLDETGTEVESYTDRMDELEERSSAASRVLGTSLLPILEFVKRGLTAGKEALAAMILVFEEAVVILTSSVLGGFQALAAALGEFMGQLRTLQFDGSKIFNTFGETMVEATENLIAEGFSRMSSQVDETVDTFGTSLDRNEEDVAEWSDKVQTEVEQVGDALLRLESQWEEGLARARQRLSDSLEDIARDFARRRAELERELAQDLEDIDAEAAEDRRRTILDAQIEERRLREDFLKDIRDLERRFLFDLEDAVRERDARRIIQLQRQFQLEKDKRTEEYEIAEKRRQEDFQRELAEIERQRQIRRQKRLEEYVQELMDLQEQESRKIEDAQRRFERAVRDLQNRINARLQLIAEGFAAETQLTADHLDRLYQMLNNAYGAGGFVEAFIQRYRALLMSGLGGSQVNLPGTTPDVVGGLPGFQRGTTGFLATSPQTIRVGEVRPERVSVTPLSAGSGTPAAGFRDSMAGGGSLSVLISLDEGLVAEIVDDALKETANVVIETFGGRR